MGTQRDTFMKQAKIKFIVRKYVMASSAQEAIRLDKKTPVADVWVDEKWVEMQAMKGEDFGFKIKDPVKQDKDKR